MKEYCVDLEIAKELKENGFPQSKTSSLYYINDKEGKYYTNYPDTIERKLKFYIDKIIHLPTSDEILKELPTGTRIKKIDNGYFVKTYPYDFIFKEKLSNALAKMWLYLKKEGYIIENNINQEINNWENEGGQ